MMRYSKRGFALLLVLWMLVGVAAIGVGLVSAGRSSLEASTNRVFLEKGEWQADGCLERARAAIDDTLRSSIAAADAAWRVLDSVVWASPLTIGCDLDLWPTGIAIDVNAASGEQLALGLEALDARPEQADSIADAILDWEDPDDIPRPAGAESAWYRDRGQFPPRNGPIAAREELSRISGVSSISGLDALLDVEPGRILIGRAPPAVLAALPGVGPEAVARASSLGADRQPRDLLEFSTMLSPDGKSELLAHFADLQKLVTFSPDAWIVSAHASIGRPAVVSTVEIRVVRAGTRAAIVRRRTWP